MRPFVVVAVLWVIVAVVLSQAPRTSDLAFAIAVCLVVVLGVLARFVSRY